MSVCPKTTFPAGIINCWLYCICPWLLCPYVFDMIAPMFWHLCPYVYTPLPLCFDTFAPKFWYFCPFLFIFLFQTLPILPNESPPSLRNLLPQKIKVACQEPKPLQSGQTFKVWKQPEYLVLYWRSKYWKVSLTLFFENKIMKPFMKIKGFTSQD